MAEIPPPVAPVVNKIDNYNTKPTVFDGERFDYWKDKIRIFFLGHNVDLCDMVVYGYKHPIDPSGIKIETRVMNEQHKKYYKNHHQERTILLNAISYNEYEKITNRDTTKSIFDSLKMTHKGNAQVKETKTLALIQILGR